jgi:hypothetical protein
MRMVNAILHSLELMAHRSLFVVEDGVHGYRDHPEEDEDRHNDH